MKLNIRAEGLFKKQNIEENEEEVVETEQSYRLPATRYNISNEEELTDALEDSTKQILLKIHVSWLHDLGNCPSASFARSTATSGNEWGPLSFLPQVGFPNQDLPSSALSVDDPSNWSVWRRTQNSLPGTSLT